MPVLECGASVLECGVPAIFTKKGLPETGAPLSKCGAPVLEFGVPVISTRRAHQKQKHRS